MRAALTYLSIVSTLFALTYSSDISAQDTQQKPPSVLYETRVDEGGFRDWPLSPKNPDWKLLEGMLLNDGAYSGRDLAPILAPYKPKSANYAVEAEIRAIEDGASFGVVVRADGNKGYAVGVGLYYSKLTTLVCDLDVKLSTKNRKGCKEESELFNPGQDWHTYRVEVNKNVITLFIDGTPITTVADNKFLDPGNVGLWSIKYQLEVRSFKIIELT